MKDFYDLWLLAGSHEFGGASEAGQPLFRSCLDKSGIFIDPGLLLGFRRYGLEPYPIQIAVGERVRLEILDALKDCTDIVISHFHRDHVP